MKNPLPRRLKIFISNRKHAYRMFGVGGLLIRPAIICDILKKKNRLAQRKLRAAFNKKKPKLYGALMQRQRGRCAHCSFEGKLTIDHKVSLSKGGGSSRKNTQLLCVPCHRKKDQAKQIN